MRALVVGSGPAGLMVGSALARRGHRVVSVDRDPGPSDQVWARRGVMQFEHAHGFRPQVATFLQSEWPQAYEAWVGQGAEPLGPGGPVLSRRSTFERGLRVAATAQAGFDLRTGHVDGLVLQHGRVVGARVDGATVEADLVVDASGRSGRLTDQRARADRDLDGDCGLAYVDRTYRLRPGADPGPTNTPIGYVGELDGYQCLIFLHEQGHFSVVLVRPTLHDALKDLRFEAAFEAACSAIPVVAEWTHVDRAEPTSGVLVGGALRNVYRRQAGLAGLVAVGDAVATTTPTRGRGIAMTCMQVGALLELLDAGADPSGTAEGFGDWCDRHVEPWVADHIAIDGGTARRWRGEDVDLDRPLTSDLIAAAVGEDPRIGEYAGGYFAMTALPDTLRPVEPLARAVYESGWRPPLADGPSGRRLAEVVAHALVPA